MLGLGEPQLKATGQSLIKKAPRRAAECFPNGIGPAHCFHSHQMPHHSSFIQRQRQARDAVVNGPPSPRLSDLDPDRLAFPPTRAHSSRPRWRAAPSRP